MNEIEALHFVQYNYQIVRHYINVEADRQIKFIQTFFNRPDFHPIVKVRKRGNRCWGGFARMNGGLHPIIDINTAPILMMDSKSKFEEYDQIQSDPEIGGFIGPWQQVAAGYVAHELAHALVFSSSAGQKFKMFRDHPEHHKEYSFDSAHGPVWQMIYSIMRDRFVNKFTPATSVGPVFKKIKINHITGLGHKVTLFTKGAELHGYIENDNLFSHNGQMVSNVAGIPNKKIKELLAA